MNITDPIADMLTRIRNANTAKHQTVDIPASNMKKAVAQILVDEGFIKSFEEIKDEKQGIIRVTLKYDENGKRVISGLKRISKPGLRIYVNKEEIPQVLNGLGIAFGFLKFVTKDSIGLNNCLDIIHRDIFHFFESIVRRLPVL